MKLRGLMFFLFVGTISPAFGEQPTPIVSGVGSAAPLPASLSGRWWTEDNRGSQTWEINKIDQNKGSALVTWWSTRRGCNISDLPVKVEYDGSTLKIAAVDPKSLPCFSSFVAELTRTGTGFEGKVYQAPGSVVSQVPYAITLIK